MTIQTKLRARVSPQVISKVTRIFNGTLDDIFNELFQNARRAGATFVAVTTEHIGDACIITVTDDGAGIANPADLVSLGQSDWSDECQTREDPAGMGFFSLAGLDTVVSSTSAAGAFSLAISGDAWTGEADIDVLPWDGPPGTQIAFHFAAFPDGKLERAVAAAARFYPLPVSYNGEGLPSADFLEGAHSVIERDRVRIGVFRQRHVGQMPTVNFHGVTLIHALPQIKEVHHAQWSARVDILDAPDLVLVLPARKEIYRNAALERLVTQCREAIFATIRAEPFHRLSFEDWLEAKVNDEDYPEASRELPPLHTVHARDTYRDIPKFEPLAANAAIYDEADSYDSVTFERALAFSRGGVDGEPHCLAGAQPLTFYTPLRQFAGYHWYDALSCYIRTGESFSQDDGFQTRSDDDGLTFRPDRITLELADQHDRRLAVPSDFAILENDDAWSDPDYTRIALTCTSSLDPGDLTELIIDAAFSPSDDADADSYDTQETRFRHDAAVRAHAILEGEDAAILAGIRMAFADRVAWRIPKGRTLQLTWSGEGTDLKLLATAGEARP